MKKLVLFFAALFATMAAVAQPVIDFQVKDHDFGKINEADGKVTTVFEFTNTGNSPLVISNVRASCGCTTPNWTKTPIEPGKTGQVTATYNPNGRPGKFTKTITVTANTTPDQTRLTIRGEVIPKSASPAQKYSIKIGEMGVAKNTIDFGNVNKGQQKKMTFEVANLGKTAHKVVVYNAEGVILSDPTATVEPGKVQTINLLLDTKLVKQWGPYVGAIYLVIDGKGAKVADNKLTVKANIVENFAAMSEADRKNAPIARYEMTNNTFVFGDISASGKAVTKKLYIQNQGAKNPLYIRRVMVNGNNIKAVISKGGISKGSKGYVAVTITPASLTPGTYTRTMTVITNDPDRSVQNVTVRFTVK